MEHWVKGWTSIPQSYQPVGLLPLELDRLSWTQSPKTS
ncbi:hypothetical protein LINPERPRIM_LOCUS5636 [Linum perenne]